MLRSSALSTSSESSEEEEAGKNAKCDGKFTIIFPVKHEHRAHPLNAAHIRNRAAKWINGHHYVFRVNAARN